MIDQDLSANFGRVLDAARHVFEQKSATRGTANIARLGEFGVLARMSDKFARLEHSDIPGEDIEDALIDTINYAAIMLLMRSGRWPGYNERHTVLPPAAHGGVYDRAAFALAARSAMRAQFGATDDYNIDLAEMANQRDTHVDQALQIQEDGATGISAPAIVGDVGYDLRAANDMTIPGSAKSPTYVPTGVRIKAPEGVWTRIVGRSSTAGRGIIVVEGIIDNGFTGEIFVGCINFSGGDVHVKAGDRLAQLICCPAITPRLAVVEQLPETARGEKGFGSTGETIEASAPALRFLNATG